MQYNKIRTSIRENIGKKLLGEEKNGFFARPNREFRSESHDVIEHKEKSFLIVLDQKEPKKYWSKDFFFGLLRFIDKKIPKFYFLMLKQKHLKIFKLYDLKKRLNYSHKKFGGHRTNTSIFLEK